MYDDFSALTEEEFAQLENGAKTAIIPHVQVEVEGSLSTSGHANDLAGESSNLTKAPHISPLQQFRPGRIFSVTDLVSPTWQYQFDYGLRQHRNRKVQNRPASFVTEQGKKIIVDIEVATTGERIMKRGKSVHKKLEREIRPVPVKVKAVSKEEHWAVRLLNMIECVDSLLLLGCAREIPVFGLVDGNIVLGVIDEIVLANESPYNYNKKRGLQSLPSTPQKSKRIRRSPSPSQLRITSWVSPTKTPTIDPMDVPSPDHTISNSPFLHLIDTKTRHKNSLPRDEDTCSSRLQLMLYHRLLTGLISTTNTFDFTFFWQKLGLDPTALFSQSFLTQALLMEEVNCLRSLVDLWHLAVARLNGAKVHSTLQLVYRSRSSRRQRSPGKRKDKLTTSSREDSEIAKAIEASLRDVHVLQDDKELAQAIEASLRDVQVRENNKEPAQASTQCAKDPEADSTATEQEVQDPALPEVIEQSFTTHLHDYGINLNSEYAVSWKPVLITAIAQSASLDNQNPVEAQETESPKGSDIIGTKEFEVDQRVLDEHLTDIMKWWNGDRKPRGVTLDQTERCFSCEYRNGCEWREQKAKEVEAEVRNRRRLNNWEISL
ncbi:exonuclease V a 5' deoxyribonuclease-domain-containing protein [Rhodocollybia butyracea]|uniref:Exonuclease V a 5' deoxyribonuclease-domain-containing protein n=1 Tax=Rhodocollybia butyracea TaxID=206335 RepID=A0A9P5UD92_9AGAR|nr:exonuclease V a 5' deoxyribonuclease-domain-containing protein [Rhodocollybia butyracea]